MIIADTGFWVALANRRDRYHDAAKQALAGIREPLITTWPVVTETTYLLLTRLGTDSVNAYLEALNVGVCQIFQLEARHLEPMRELVQKYRELPMDLADASLVVLASELGTGRILSTDQRDFRSYRWKRRKPFLNLLPALD